MSPQYLFEETFDRRVYQWCQLQNSVWRKNLTAEQYVERERHLAMTRVCDVERDLEQFHGIHYFVLRDLSIEKDESKASEEYDLTYNIVASCETLNRKSWKFVNDESGVHKIDVISPCIGAVHTLEHHRGKGFASEMISRLCLLLEEQLEKDNFITLYSEVGDFYDKFGFKRYEVPTLEFPVKSEKPTLDDKFTFVKFAGFDELSGVYNGRFLKNIYRHMAQDESRKNTIALIPTIDIVEWHHARSNFISQTLTGEDPGNFGVELKDQHDNVIGFVIFSHDYVEKSLYLVMVYANDFETLKKLLDAVQYEAINIGYNKVTCWESDLLDYKVWTEEGEEKEKLEQELKNYVTQDLNGTLGLKNGSVSAVKMLDGNNDVNWFGNGKWAWF